MQIRLPQSDGSLKTLTLKAQPIVPKNPVPAFNRVVYAAAHVVIDPLATADPWDASPIIDWDATMAFREHLWRLGFRIAEAMDTAQRGMGVDWPVARELIGHSLRHARTIPGADLACGVGTDQLVPTADVTIADVEAAYREQFAAVESEGGRVILMASRALVQSARSADDYLALYGRLLRDASQPVVLHWLGEMFDPALRGYWGSTDIATALDTVAALIHEHAAKVEGIKVSLLDAQWEIALRRRLAPGVKMYTGDDFNYAEADCRRRSFVLARPAGHLRPDRAGGCGGTRRAGARPALTRSVHCSIPRWCFRARSSVRPHATTKPAWCSSPGSTGTRSTFRWPAALQSARGAAHFAKVFELADACGALTNPDLALHRMKQYLAVACGVDA